MKDGKGKKAKRLDKKESFLYTVDQIQATNNDKLDED
jgi:hypothetical protein